MSYGADERVGNIRWRSAQPASSESMDAMSYSEGFCSSCARSMLPNASGVCRNCRAKGILGKVTRKKALPRRKSWEVEAPHPVTVEPTLA